MVLSSYLLSLEAALRQNLGRPRQGREDVCLSLESWLKLGNQSHKMVFGGETFP